MGMAASIFPLYTVEITEPKYKSTVGSVFGVAVGAGVVIACGPDSSVRDAAAY